VGVPNIHQPSKAFVVLLTGSRNAFLPLILGVALSACSDPVEPQAATPPVKTFVLQAPGESPFRQFPGEVASLESIDLSFEVAGRLINFPANQGMVVEAGDLLGELDQTNFVARFDAAQSRMNNARDELNRNRQLNERGVISDREYDQFRTNFEVVETEFRTAQRALEDTKLKAPFDGRVASTLVNNLQNVQAQQPVLVFQNNSMLEIDIQVPESSMIQAGQGITSENARHRLEAQVEFPALPGQRFDLVLQSFSSAASAMTRTFRMTFYLVPPEGQNILPGMTSTVLVRLKPEESANTTEAGQYLVPIQAVSTTGNESAVWKFNEATSTASRVPVEQLGLSGDRMLVASPDLAVGDEIITSGVRFLTNGMTVRRLSGSGR